MIYGEELGAGGISTKTIPPQGLNLTLKGGNGKIDCTFTGIASEWLYLGQYYRMVAKPGSAPTSPMDGVQIKDVQVGAIGDAVISASIEGLTNGVQYYARLYVRGENGWQTSVDAVGTATPMAGIAIGSLAVGSEVKLNLGGVDYNHLIVHHGNPDATMYDTSCDGSWLLMKDIYESRQWHSSNTNVLENSTIQSYLNGTFLDLFDADIKAAIKQVKIPYRRNGGSGGTNQSGANGLSCKIFLLSGYEVGFATSVNQYFPVDGAKLSYFEDGDGTSARNKRVATLNGSATRWWLRSPITNDTRDTWSVNSDGGCNHSGCSNSYGVRPAFILPADFLLNPEPNPDGSYSPLAA